MTENTWKCESCGNEFDYDEKIPIGTDDGYLLCDECYAELDIELVFNGETYELK